jgi:hypothetical protein
MKDCTPAARSAAFALAGPAGKINVPGARRF